MDPHKICFITCVSDNAQYEKALLFMKALTIPDGCRVEYLPIRNAASMTSGYNRAMRQSDAKYKIYLHQDTYIVNPDFLVKTLGLFAANPRLGMLGVIGVGAPLPGDAVWAQSEETYGMVYFIPNGGPMTVLKFNKNVNAGYAGVRVIDGMLMATQYDLPWREELFPGWHFYDTSQSMEFIRAGYEVGVLGQEAPWTVHDMDTPDLRLYEENRQLFVREYGDLLK